MKVDIDCLANFFYYKLYFKLVNRIVTIILNFKDLFIYN